MQFAYCKASAFLKLIRFPVVLRFQIKSRYSLIRPIGHGAYGVVISALDKETGDKVAIKKISRAFEDPIDAKRILREIKLMKKFSHENVRDILLCAVLVGYSDS